LSAKEKEDNELTEKITMIFMEHKCHYGARRIMHALRKLGYTISSRRVGRLMQAAGLYCKTRRKFKHTTDSNHTMAISPNLLNRDFSPSKPDTAYAGDITSVPTREGWLFLAVAIDLFSRQVVGWADVSTLFRTHN